MNQRPHSKEYYASRKGVEKMGCETKLTNIFSLISVAAAPAIGVLIAVLFANNLLPGIITGVWIAIAVAALVLVGLIAAGAVNSAGEGRRVCLPCRIGSIVAAAAGTLFVGVAALVIGLTVGSLLSAVLVGAGAFFFVFLVIQAVNLAICLAAKSCRY